ncbi:hypothetical protein A1O3_02708 [Capronia epimyces CBS 606.96]|uniref:Zn(2)-C6 fungal-type domain-containing protein n=1 Tax=Capronia epimyces CBS 606.96 TaxID=1182542 RepID=W9YK68_9EURO|nr:uncharacterized protein A1O3_02708 [Capronia epimyces CBS 606.96]EXJ89641.1 hypothetical protein A1O3_02708 [Capronia epimyces CBS 606.96]
MVNNFSQSQVKLRDTCESCAAAKVRCSKEKPACSRCSSRGLRCEYGTSRRSGRASSSSHSTAGYQQKNQTQTQTANGDRSKCPSQSQSPGEGMMLRPDAVAVNQDEWLASLMGFPPDDHGPDTFNDMNSVPMDASMSMSTTSTSIQDMPDYRDLMSYPFGPGGGDPHTNTTTNTSIDALFNINDHDLTAMTWEGLQEPDLDGHDCLSIALDLFKRCSATDSSPTTCPRRLSFSRETPPLTLETVDSIHQHMIEPLSRILDCSCSSNGSLITIVSLVIFKIIAWYARAASLSPAATAAGPGSGPGSSEGSSNSSSSMPLDSRFSVTDLLGASDSHAGCRGLMNCTGAAGDKRGRAAVRAILDDLYRVQDIVDRFSVRAQTARLQDMKDGSGAGSDARYGQHGSGAAGSGSDIQAAISGHLLPLSNTLSVQVLAELRRRLRAVSFEVVQTLLRGCTNCKEQS